jgi:hypothetical protein
VPLGELRRQLQIDSDEVTPIQTPEGTFYVGLPADGAAVLGQLWHEGRIVFDCTPDLRAMVVRAIAPTRLSRVPFTRTQTARPGATRVRGPRVGTPEASAGLANVDRAPETRTELASDSNRAGHVARTDSGSPRRVPGFEGGDEFLPAPAVDVFAAVGVDTADPTPGQPIFAPRPVRSVANGDDRVAEGAEDRASVDDSGRRRRRGGIGRGTRSQ